MSEEKAKFFSVAVVEGGVAVCSFLFVLIVSFRSHAWEGMVSVPTLIFFTVKINTCSILLFFFTDY